MIPDLHAKLKAYTESFNARDFEINSQAIRNEHAYDYLSTQIPLVELPDPELEKIYYFRWWTLRKHWKRTSHGHIMTEFLPMVPWAGECNSINCPAGHHLREGRWLTDQDGWMKDYIRFWLNGPGNPYSYSMWLASAVEDYLAIHPDDAFLAECLDPLVA